MRVRARKVTLLDGLRCPKPLTALTLSRAPDLGSVVSLLHQTPGLLSWPVRALDEAACVAQGGILAWRVEGSRGIIKPAPRVGPGAAKRLARACQWVGGCVPLLDFRFTTQLRQIHYHCLSLKLSDASFYSCSFYGTFHNPKQFGILFQRLY